MAPPQGPRRFPVGPLSMVSHLHNIPRVPRKAEGGRVEFEERLKSPDNRLDVRRDPIPGRDRGPSQPQPRSSIAGVRGAEGGRIEINKNTLRVLETERADSRDRKSINENIDNIAEGRHLRGRNGQILPLDEIKSYYSGNSARAIPASHMAEGGSTRRSFLQGLGALGAAGAVGLGKAKKGVVDSLLDIKEELPAMAKGVKKTIGEKLGNLFHNFHEEGYNRASSAEDIGEQLRDHSNLNPGMHGFDNDVHPNQSHYEKIFYGDDTESHLPGLLPRDSMKVVLNDFINDAAKKMKMKPEDLRTHLGPQGEEVLARQLEAKIIGENSRMGGDVTNVPHYMSHPGDIEESRKGLISLVPLDEAHKNLYVPHWGVNENVGMMNASGAGDALRAHHGDVLLHVLGDPSIATSGTRARLGIDKAKYQPPKEFDPNLDWAGPELLTHLKSNEDWKHLYAQAIEAHKNTLGSIPEHYQGAPGRAEGGGVKGKVVSGMKGAVEDLINPGERTTDRMLKGDDPGSGKYPAQPLPDLSGEGSANETFHRPNRYKYNTVKDMEAGRARGRNRPSMSSDKPTTIKALEEKQELERKMGLRDDEE